MEIIGLYIVQFGPTKSFVYSHRTRSRLNRIENVGPNLNPASDENSSSEKFRRDVGVREFAIGRFTKIVRRNSGDFFNLKSIECGSLSAGRGRAIS
jgi:hypothetical protein